MKVTPSNVKGQPLTHLTRNARENTPANIGGPCPIGTYCPAGSTRPLDCPDGTYNNVTKAEKCKDCPPGFFCDKKVPISFIML
jgi:hypothetical protein